MVGVNEELTSRVAVLGVLRRAYSRRPAVVLTGALFGLQHFSLLVTTPGRSVDGIALNVLASATYGFALAAYQARFAWVLPLIVIHALADMTVIMLTVEVSLAVHMPVYAGFVVVGVLLLRTAADDAPTDVSERAVVRQRRAA